MNQEDLEVIRARLNAVPPTALEKWPRIIGLAIQSDLLLDSNFDSQFQLIRYAPDDIRQLLVELDRLNAQIAVLIEELAHQQGRAANINPAAGEGE